MAAAKVAAHRERGAYEISTTYTPLMWQHSGSSALHENGVWQALQWAPRHAKSEHNCISKYASYEFL